MKITKIIVTIIMALTIAGCHDGAKKDDGVVVADDAADSFQVSLTVVAQNDDDFCVLYTQDGSVNFQEGVWKGVDGSPQEQVVQIILPVDVFPTQLRLDLGKNSAPEGVVLKSVKFDYRGKSRLLTGVEMAAFFRADTFKCTFDATTGIVKALEKDGKTRELSLYPLESIMAVELPTLKN